MTYYAVGFDVDWLLALTNLSVGLGFERVDLAENLVRVSLNSTLWYHDEEATNC